MSCLVFFKCLICAAYVVHAVGSSLHPSLHLDLIRALDLHLLPVEFLFESAFIEVGITDLIFKPAEYGICPEHQGKADDTEYPEDNRYIEGEFYSFKQLVFVAHAHKDYIGRVEHDTYDTAKVMFQEVQSVTQIKSQRCNNQRIKTEDGGHRSDNDLFDNVVQVLIGADADKIYDTV